MTPQPRKQYRPKTGGRWRAVNPDRPPVFSEVSEVRIHPDDMGLVREQHARYWIWTRLDDYPAPGYTTSVHVSEEEGGWVITDLVVSRSPVHLPGDSTVEDVPWLSNGVITNGRNEAGVTPAVLKDLRISEIRAGVLARFDNVDGADLPIRAATALEALRASFQPGSRAARDPLTKARLALSYEALTREGASGNRVHQDLADLTGKSPHTISGYVRDLRSEGYLTSAGSGRAGGAITQQSHEILIRAGDL